MATVARLSTKCFVYDFVTTGIFRYFKLGIMHRLLKRHALINMNGIVEVFGSFSATFLPIQEDCTLV